MLSTSEGGRVVIPEQRGRGRFISSSYEALESFVDLYPRVVDWRSPTPCGQWTVIDLAGHLLAIARYWSRLLDAAEAGRPYRGLPRGGRLAAMNADELRGLGKTSGPRRMEEYLALAGLYVRRIALADWGITLGEWEGLGPLTVGQHFGIAIGEWHVHAWDMACALGQDHRPSDPSTVASGNRVVREISVDGDQWMAVLKAYERDVHWRRTPR